MARTIRWLCVLTILGLGLLLCASLAPAELAEVYLKSGLKLRGKVTISENEIAIRNELGELRYPRDQVERIVLVVPTTTQPAEPTEPDAADTKRAEFPAPPPLSPLDIQRLKMHELRLDGPAENVKVRFASRTDQRTLSEEILKELSRRADYEQAWEEILLRGQLNEKLQLIVATTGTKYADRLNIISDPEVFTTFRTRVLPLIVKGCARPGCHSGPRSQVFRFSRGSHRSETYAYTTFALLERKQTSQGRLIDRDDPEGSLLLGYMLPSNDNPKAHPPVKGKRPISPVLHNRRSPAYRSVVDWINSLTTPWPDYGLDYVFPAPPSE